MKTEERIKTVFKCSKCGSEIAAVRYHEEYDYASGFTRRKSIYECHACGHKDGDFTVVKEYITEVTERPYTNEELEEMIKELDQRIEELEVKLTYKVDEIRRVHG